MNMKSIVFVVAVAVALGGIVGCETTPTQQGAVAGGALGAGAGAIIGNQSGRSGEGALIGAGVGAITGALVGDQVDEHRKRKAQEQPVQQAPAAQSAPAASAQPTTTTQSQKGHWETRTVKTESGETYEERVWVPES